MSFYDTYHKYKDFDFNTFFRRVKIADLKKALLKEKLEPYDLLALLSPLGESYLEEIAQKAKDLTLQYFGKAITLYTPLYLANYCNNECIYCGFNSSSKIKRRKLNLQEVEKEADFIAKSGLKHVLILTGESRDMSPLSYIKECIKILKKYFSSISIEIYPLAEEEYKDVIAEGIDGITLYQEVYDEKVYKKLHLSGPKANYRLRLDAPERAARAAIRTITIGALLGLGDPKTESFFTGMHAQYLQDKYPSSEISVSVPRIRPTLQNFAPSYEVKTRQLLQIITSLKIFLPRVGITLSTRESSQLRDNIVGLGVTKISAGSTTAVGGHTAEEIISKQTTQFEISDQRSVNEIKKMLILKGYQPVLKDWVGTY